MLPLPCPRLPWGGVWPQQWRGGEGAASVCGSCATSRRTDHTTTTNTIIINNSQPPHELEGTHTEPGSGKSLFYEPVSVWRQHACLVSPRCVRCVRRCVVVRVLRPPWLRPTTPHPARPPQTTITSHHRDKSVSLGPCSYRGALS